MTSIKNYLTLPIVAGLLLTGGAIAGYASITSAQSADGETRSERPFKPGKGFHRGPHGKGPGVVGEVTGVSGATITLTGRNGETFTVNASGAEISRIVAGALSDIQVGDRIGVHGEVSDNSVTAKRIMDDLPPPPQNQ